MRVAAIVPTIAGREDSLERTLAAYAATAPGVQVRVERDHPCWPAACNAGTVWALSEGFDVVHFGADDLEPKGDWLSPCLPVLEANELPEARIWNWEYRPDVEPWSATHDEVPGETCRFPRVPILTRGQLELFGSWPEIIYYADCWLGDAGRRHGIPTRVVQGYDFVHYWHQHGRLDGDERALADAEAAYERACALLYAP